MTILYEKRLTKIFTDDRVSDCKILYHYWSHPGRQNIEP